MIPDWWDAALLLCWLQNKGKDAPAANSQVSDGVEVGAKDPRVAEDLISEGVEAIQDDTNLRGRHPILRHNDETQRSVSSEALHEGTRKRRSEIVKRETSGQKAHGVETNKVRMRNSQGRKE